MVVHGVSLNISSRALTPDMVLRQLKYRYDREIDHCERYDVGFAISSPPYPAPRVTHASPNLRKAHSTDLRR